jgi:hypothetical protein
MRYFKNFRERSNKQAISEYHHNIINVSVDVSDKYHVFDMVPD